MDKKENNKNNNVINDTFEDIKDTVKSNKKTIGALLNILLPIGGIGRIYLGYTELGIIQLILSFFVIGKIWSIVDGILILLSKDFRDKEGNPIN
ncbi:MAG: TM2 domain-containing protein [Bacillales bacterium]